MTNINRREHRAPLTATPLRRRDDLDALVHAAKGGDERAWELIIGRFDATIRAVARRHGLSPADRDEVAQQTCIQLLLNIDRVKQHAALGGWLRTTAQRECLRVLAAAHREVPVDEPINDDADDGTSLEDRVALNERRDALRRALETVPGHERRVMRLMLDEPGLSYDDLGAALGIPRGSIGPTRGRCLARLRGDSHLASVVGVSGTPNRRRPPGHNLSLTEV